MVTSVTVGGRTGVVLFEPLNGGSPEGRVTWVLKLQEGSKGSSITGVSLGQVPPQGFFKDHTGPTAAHFITCEWLHLLKTDKLHPGHEEAWRKEEIVGNLNPDHVKAVLNAINEGPYFKHLSMFVTNMGLGYSVVELEILREHLNPFGAIHGGVYASAIDTAAYWAVYCELGEDLGLVSIDLKIDYLAPMNHGKLIVKGQSIKIGKTICLAEATATDQNDKWLAHGTSKMMVTSGLQTIGDAVHFTGTQKLPAKFI